jgi:hypothetical protein
MSAGSNPKLTANGSVISFMRRKVKRGADKREDTGGADDAAFKGSRSRKLKSGRSFNADKPNGTGSVVSGGSGTTGASSMSTAETIRRGVRARGNRLEPSLLVLRRALSAVFALATIVNIVSFVITSALFSDLCDNFDVLAMTSHRVVDLQEGISHVQLNLMSRDAGFARRYGEPAYEFETNVGVRHSREMLRLSLNDVESSHEHLYMSAAAGGNSLILKQYTDAMRPTEDLTPHGYVNRDNVTSTFRNMSLANVGLEYVSRGRSFWWAKEETLGPGELDVFWLTRNGPFVVLEAFNQSSMDASLAADGLASIVHYSNVAVLAVACFVFGFVSIAAMVPSVLSVQREKDRVFVIFRNVPMKVIRYMRDLLSMRILAAKRLQDDDDGEGAEQAAEFEENLLSRRNMVVSQDNDEDDDEHDKSKGEAGTGNGQFFSSVSRLFSFRSNRVGPQSKTHRPHRQRNFRNSSNNRMMTVKLAWPLIIFIAYYVATYIWRQDVVKTASYNRNEILWSSQAELAAPNIAFHLRNGIMYNEPHWVQRNLDKAAMQTSFLKNLVNGLACTY